MYLVHLWYDFDRRAQVSEAHRRHRVTLGNFLLTFMIYRIVQFATPSIYPSLVLYKLSESNPVF
jgi:hypothetical protein